MQGEMTAHGVHPESEQIDRLGTVGQAVEARPLAVDTLGRRFHVEWDAQAPVTPLGQLVFFAQFLAAGGLYGDWVRTCPLRFTSPNAPELTDLLGTIMLAIPTNISGLSTCKANRPLPCKGSCPGS